MPSAPYDTVENVLQAARVRLNDAIESIGGEILTDTAPFSQQVTNNAWRRLQELLSDFGLQVFNRDLILTAVAGTTLTDQGQFVYFNFSEYYNGSSQTAPLFPQDMIAPLALEERVNGSTANFWPMDQCFNGLPTAPRGPLNLVWEWRQETIYMPGATGATDIRLRYQGYLADFEDNTPISATPWYGQNVPMMRALNPLAWYICSEMAKARGDLDAAEFDKQAEAGADLMFHRDWRQDKSLYKGAEVGKMTDRYTPTQGPEGPRGPQQGQ